ncbi:MAG: hypothetical protein QM658_15850 [Gordonia sp. (in: high G+C Gram-positive bacteria)]
MTAGAGWRRRVSAVRAAVADWVRRAPVTYGWLALLLVTTILQRVLSPQRLHTLLGRESTNLHNLQHHPFRVMIASLLWIDGAVWLPYLFGFTVTVAVVEHWLGSWRMVATGLIGHVFATLISVSILAEWIRTEQESASMLYAIDVGVSYFAAAIVGVSAYRIARPWRWVWALGALAFFAGPVVLTDDPSFTAVGHLSALILGFCCYPLTLGKPWRRTDWDPRVAARAYSNG